MRIYDFPNVRTFELMYEGLVVTSTKGADTRAIGRVIEELEKVGVKKSKDGKESLLYTLAENKPIEIADADHEVVKRLLETVDWNGLSASAAGKMLDWLSEAPTKENYEKKKQALSNGILELHTSDEKKT